MNCEKCGEYIPVNYTNCPRCQAPLSFDTENVNPEETPVDEQGKPVKNVRIMAKLISNNDGYAPEPARTDAKGFATLSSPYLC